jgi:probable HAF family extracellular repeat protein
VGLSTSSCDFTTTRAFLWENGGPMVDLNTLVVPVSNVQLSTAFDINDRGEIAAPGLLPNGDSHAVLLMPCDENHPGIEDCDYTMVEGSAAVSAHTVAPNLSRPVLPFSFWHRNDRFHLAAPGPRD